MVLSVILCPLSDVYDFNQSRTVFKIETVFDVLEPVQLVRDKKVTNFLSLLL